MRSCFTAFLLGMFAGVSTLAADGSADAFNRILDALPVIDEIDTAKVPPAHQFPAEAGVVTNILGRSARVLPPGPDPKGMAWMLGQKCDLKPGAAYLLSVEFPDDVPRSIFIANRGADQVRGFATGRATGDVRQQYTQPSLESLDYPQTGQWQRYRSLFILHERFQGLRAQRDPKPGGRPFTPGDGFHVVLFQSYQINDPCSEGVAVGRIRLHAVPNLAALAGSLPAPAPGLPRRRVFFREEMADEPISGKAVEDRAMADPVDWYAAKARVARVLGFNTLGKDLLEFGFNQGWDSGDPAWVMNAQPPLSKVWDQMIPRIAAEGLDLLPYFEYKGALGLPDAKPPSLAWQRRAEKLYHTDTSTNYSGTWWVERHNADLTDPETLADAKRLLDVTVLKHKAKGNFAGAWFRMRGNHLPISFAESTLARFREAHAADPAVRSATRAALVASYEGDRKLYGQYLQWWFERRAQFFSVLREHLAAGLQQPDAQLILTPWPSEPVPLLRNPQSGDAGHPVQITTDDVAWWDAFARGQSNSSWFRWAYAPTAFDTVIKERIYRRSLAFREPVSPLPWRHEPFHAAPNGDPEHYRSAAGVMLSFPIGRLFTVADQELLDSYRSAAGLTVIHHYTLNEDSPSDRGHRGPFGGEVGYTCVDVDRAGPYVCLLEARALALGDPVNIGALCGSVYSTGFPGYVRQFHRAFLSVPALPSTRVAQAASDPEVIIRQVETPSQGTYFYVINTSLQTKRDVRVTLPGEGSLQDLLDEDRKPVSPLQLSLYPGEVRSYRRR